LKIKKIQIIILLFLNIKCVDNPHFYKASHFWQEPRFQEEDLNTFEIWAGAGKTCTGFNLCGKKVNILQIYGDETLSLLFKNVPQILERTYPKTILNNIWEHQPEDSDFGKIRFTGKFRMTEADIDLQKNFCNGFFGELHLPIRKLEIYDVNYENLSTYLNKPEGINYQKWSTFVNFLPENLRMYDINIDGFKSKGVGDLSLLLGYTVNHENTEYIDFIDFTAKAGILFPTGKKKNLNNPFSIPLGYNGHYALNISANVAVGLYEWLTLGAYAEGLFFRNRQQEVKMKTAFDQNGFIKLTSGCANVDQGSIVSAGIYAKADHISRGLSFLIAYRFDKQFRTFLFPKSRLFNYEIVNSDKELFGFQMNTLNFVLEYDWATYECPQKPRAQLFFDIPVSGKQIYKTKLIGLGVIFDW